MMKQTFRSLLLLLFLNLMSSVSVCAEDYGVDMIVGEATNGEPNTQYSTSCPLVYEDANDLWPYAFTNEAGEDMGFNVDLVRMVLDRLNIPYIIKLKPRREVLEDLRDGRADLSLGLEANYHNPYAKFGKSTLVIFTHSVVWSKDKPQTIFSEDDLADNEVYVHRGSFSHHLMNLKGWGNKAIGYENMKDVVLKVSQSGEGQVLWNTMSLKWILRNFHLDNLQIAPVDMTDADYKFMSNDENLLNIIDAKVEELRTEGQLTPLQNKWFYPNQHVIYVPSWQWHILNTSIVAFMLLLVFLYITYLRERRATATIQSRTTRLKNISMVSHVSIWLYNVLDRSFTNLDWECGIRSTYTAEQFTGRLRPMDHDRIFDAIGKVVRQEEESVSVEVMTFAESNPTGGDRIYLITMSILRSNGNKPEVVIAVCNDVTDEREMQRKADEQLMRYRTVFETPLVDMVYFDKDGYITDMNMRAQTTLKMSLSDTLKERVNLRDVLAIDNFDYEHFDTFRVTRFINSHGEKNTIKSRKVTDAMIYDMQVVAVRDEEGKMICTYGTGLDITDQITTYQRTLRAIAQVRESNEELTRYAEDVNYVMGVGGVRMVEYSPDTHTLAVFKGLNTIQHQLSPSRCMILSDESSKKKAMRAMTNMDHRINTPIDVEILTTLRVKGIPLYLHFRMVPVYNNCGNVTSYFGMCRDVSEIKATELLLEKETARAQEIENLKNSFLRNMSYEIRTPLNSVVGFAEMFEMDHSPEDEEIFIREIKDSSAHLLNLINDILFLSRLDAKMIEITPQPTEFSTTFAGHCAIGWSGHEREGVEYVAENHYETLVVEIDDTNVGRVIEQVISNAVAHTDKGYVRARYDYVGDNLTVIVEDSGTGIAPQQLKQIFERFSSSGKGTGLGLPICKELVEQMGGVLNITSHVGRGTTVLFSIPCKVLEMKRK